MPNWAAVADVQARLPYRTIGASTTPSTADVTAWLNEAEAIIRAELTAQSLPNTFTSSGDPEAVVKELAITYAEGRTRQAYAGAGGDGDNDDGVSQIRAFGEWRTDLRARPAIWGEILGAGSAAAGAVRFRSHVTNHPDGKSIAAGDFRPTITTTEVF